MLRWTCALLALTAACGSLPTQDPSHPRPDARTVQGIGSSKGCFVTIFPTGAYRALWIRFGESPTISVVALGPGAGKLDDVQVAEEAAQEVTLRVVRGAVLKLRATCPPSRIDRAS